MGDALGTTSTARSIEHVKSAITIVRRVIARNQRLAPFAVHTASAEQRVIEGEMELAVLEAELAALEANDVGAALDIHEGFDAIGR
jgi:hypothetical protein